MAALIPGQALAQALAPPLNLPDYDALPYLVERHLIVDYPATATCGGELMNPVRMEPLRPRLINPPPVGSAYNRTTLAPLRLAFDIAADGRPHSIRVEQTQPSPVIVDGDLGPEVQASLLGWRFPRRAKTGCILQADAVTTSLAKAPEALIARTLALMGTGNPDGRRVLLRALQRVADDCRTTPGRRTVVSPAPDVRPEAGTRAWTVLRYDIAPDGRVRLGEAIDSSPDPAVIRSVSETYAQTEFQPGKPRRGCIVVLERYGATAPPGPIPMPDWEPLNRCTPAQRARFKPGQLTYPPAFLNRGIEGWALVRFDVASWGQVGGIELIQAEPAQALGDQALSIIRQGRGTPAFEHAGGCVDRVIFRIGDTGGAGR